jgi:putative protease
VKDNDQTRNLAALVDAGIRSFKIEGRYKDLAYVKNVTAHYRRHLDEILSQRPQLRAASSGRCRFFFAPDPARNFHRGHTGYFVNGRGEDVGAFDSPKYAGLPVGHVVRVERDGFELETGPGVGPLHNGDGLTYYEQQSLVGVAVNRATALAPGGPDATLWRIEPNEPMATLRDLRAGVAVSRNRDQGWNRLLEGRTSERRIAVDWLLGEDEDGLYLQATDADGNTVRAAPPREAAPAHDAGRAEAALRDCLGRLGGTIFEARGVELAWRTPRFLPAAAANAWRRAAVERLEALRTQRLARLPRRAPLQPPVAYPEQHLSYLGNVANSRAAAFYARHGVQVIEAAYESHRETGEVSLMITKHCIRWSLSLCPKQAKGVTGVQGSVRAEPMTMVNGKERLTLRFDCKACEMHVVGRLKKSVLAGVAAVPVRFAPRRAAQGPQPPGAAAPGEG